MDELVGRSRPNRAPRARLLLLVAVLTAVAAFWFVSPRPSAPPRNVVFFSIDTCRADRLSCYGFGSPTTPHIDALAADGIRFSHAISTAPITLPAHASMMTGTTPPAHGARDNDMQLGQEAVTLAEVLSDRGLRTGAIVAASVLRSAAGLAQGFQSYDDQFSGVPEQFMAQRRCDEVVDRALAWLREHSNEPFFLFVHLFDPHGDYAPPEPFATEFKDDLYAGEVAYADACVGRVIQELKALDLYDSTLILVTSDHGEGLGDHGEGTHSYFVYQSTLHVPWVMRVPGLEQPQTIDMRVSVVDQMPTILGLLNVAVPPGMEGRDLTPFLRDEVEAKTPSPALYSESVHPTVFGCSPLFSVLEGDWKYIHSAEAELYDLSSDPNESDNRFDRERDRAERMRESLERSLAAAESRSFGSQPMHLSPEEVRMLESLGYAVGGGSDFDYDQNEKRESPRSFLPDFIEHAKIHGKVGYWTRGAAEDAEDRTQEVASLLERARALADRRPEIQQFQYDAAVLARMAGDDAFAEKYYRRTVALAPQRADATLALSDLLAARGDSKGAYQQLAAAIRAGADPIRPHVKLATALAHRGEWEEALRRLRDALAEYPDAQPLGAALASILMQAKRYDEALVECIAALRKHPRSVGLHLLKVDILVAADRTSEAATALAAALEVHPGDAALLARKRQLEAGPIHPSKTQLVTVVSESWDAFRATLRRYERSPEGPWMEVGAPIQVVLGHAGYGWGRGLHGDEAPDGRGGPTKREGDGRSPAGVFELGPMYGYEAVLAGVSVPYVKATPTLRCVDDPTSLHYNRIVSTSKETRDWTSAEHMLRKDDLYQIAIVVAHNTTQPEPGAGSCIFLHVWVGPDTAVRGCTAMSKPDLQTLSEWLDPKRTVLVALPMSEYHALRNPWNLP